MLGLLYLQRRYASQAVQARRLDESPKSPAAPRSRLLDHLPAPQGQPKRFDWFSRRSLAIRQENSGVCEISARRGAFYLWRVTVHTAVEPGVARRKKLQSCETQSYKGSRQGKEPHVSQVLNDHAATRASLLSPSRWPEFIEVYHPFVAKWLRILHAQQKLPLPADMLDDLQQEILLHVQRNLESFEHNGRRGAFRAWLKTVTTRCLWTYLRREKIYPAAGGSDFHEVVEQLADDASQLSRQFDVEHNNHVLRALLEKVRDEFEPTTWQAFVRVTLLEQPAAEAGKDLGITANAVRIAKARVLRRLREEADELLDSSFTLPGRAME
jgi:RNA polymerase sigma-70 factor (ECF subfamily)